MLKDPREQLASSSGLLNISLLLTTLRLSFCTMDLVLDNSFCDNIVNFRGWRNNSCIRFSCEDIWVCISSVVHRYLLEMSRGLQLGYKSKTDLSPFVTKMSVVAFLYELRRPSLLRIPRRVVLRLSLRIAKILVIFLYNLSCTRLGKPHASCIPTQRVRPLLILRTTFFITARR